VWSFPLRIFVWVDTPLANLHCITFWRPSFQLALPCPWSPNLGQAILKKLSRSQNCFLIQHMAHIFSSAPLCGRFHYGSPCGWVPLLTTPLALHLGALPRFHYDSPCGCPSYQLALPCLWVPNLGQAVLKK
jgi:hypothetical protein